MRVRTGFVSNSSSSSFILDGEKYDRQFLESLIRQSLKIDGLINKKQGYSVSSEGYDLKKVCKIRTEPDCESFIQEMSEFYMPGGSRKYQSFVDSFTSESNYIRNSLGTKKCIIVDSVGDNSIPWRTQEILESIAVHRQHWG